MRLLITAGPTHEPIDAVRFLGNRSSGRLGLALAEAGLAAGHDVTLLLGPVCEPALPAGLGVERFETTEALQAALKRHFPGCDVLMMAAAVADYRPASPEPGKHRRSVGEPWALHLEPTPDLVAASAAERTDGQRVVAFALGPAEALLERAQAKLQRKGVDAVVANPLPTMGSEAVALTWVSRGGEAETSGEVDKSTAAQWLIQRVERLAGE